MSTQTFAHQKIEHIRSMNTSPSPLQSALARCKVDPRKSGMYEVQLERAADRYHYDMDLEDRRAELGARVSYKELNRFKDALRRDSSAAKLQEPLVDGAHGHPELGGNLGHWPSFGPAGNDHLSTVI